MFSRIDAIILSSSPRTNKFEAHGDQGIFHVASSGNHPLVASCSSHPNEVLMEVSVLLREKKPHPAVVGSSFATISSGRLAPFHLHLLGKGNQRLRWERQLWEGG